MCAKDFDLRKRDRPVLPKTPGKATRNACHKNGLFPHNATHTYSLSPGSDAQKLSFSIFFK